MSRFKRLTEVFELADDIPFDDSSKFILFSDIHRGDNSWADDFAHNQSLYMYALQYYFKKGFTCIELGDNDELLENSRFADIRSAHSHIFWQLRKFYNEGRLYLIFGNHDIERKDPKVVEQTLFRYFDEHTQRYEPLFDGVEVHEGIVLRHWETASRIFVIHGHQGSLYNDNLWLLAKFFSRNFWRPLQFYGVRDLTSPAKNYRRRKKVEREIIHWVKVNNQVLICGHTHRPVFPSRGAPPYFNTGSCVHPRCITGIELENGSITLIKWLIKPRSEEGGALFVEREVLAGPEKLQSFFPDNTQRKLSRLHKRS